MTKITPQQDGKDDLRVEVVGASLMRRALENYLQALPGIATLQGNSKARRLVLIIGQEGQEYVKSRRTSRQASRKNVHYVLLTNGNDIDYTLARDLPIGGFIADDDPPEMFLEGLHAAAAGISFCSPRLVPTFVAAALPAERADIPTLTFSAGNDESAPLPIPSSEQATHEDLFKTKNSRSKKHPLGLSAREAEIVSHAAHGLSNNEIADTLYLSLPTIKFHLYRAYQKIGIHRRSQLAGALSGMN